MFFWVYFPKHKSEAFVAFLRFKTTSGSFIIIIRSDNGAEFTSNQFKDFLQKLEFITNLKSLAHHKIMV